MLYLFNIYVAAAKSVYTITIILEQILKPKTSYFYSRNIQVWFESDCLKHFSTAGGGEPRCNQERVCIEML